jgi:succinate dehydrogenase/fumarate reductase flavoprotein subunit
LKHLRIPGDSKSFNPELDKAGRVADFIELGQLMVEDALHRLESCGGHFREEYQTPDGETLRRCQLQIRCSVGVHGRWARPFAPQGRPDL